MRERILYHQLHPVKLAVDWGAGLAGAVLLWEHRLLAGLLWGFLPPMVASAPFLFGAVDATLARYRTSPLGRYLARSMTRAMEGVRLLGLLVIWLGAWHRQTLPIVLGLGLIVGAWARGWLWPPRGSPPAAN